jgi:hypothetical protein
MMRFASGATSALLSLGLACSASETRPPDSPLDRDLAKWVTIAPYADTSPEMRCANWSRAEWRAYIATDTVRARPVSPGDELPPLPFRDSGAGPRRAYLGIGRSAKVIDGWLVGYDHGEFGGAVWWFSPDGRKSAKVSDNQVSAFFKIRGALVATGGVAHLGIDEGWILQLTQAPGGRWQAASILDLGDSPEAPVQESDSTLLIVGARHLTRVRFSNGSSPATPTVLARGNWGMLYPNSAVRTPSGTVYVGMRFAVLRLVPDHDHYAESWLVPAECRSTALDTTGMDCRCTATGSPPGSDGS